MHSSLILHELKIYHDTVVWARGTIRGFGNNNIRLSMTDKTLNLIRFKRRTIYCRIS
jgi:hypothetical protein